MDQKNKITEYVKYIIAHPLDDLYIVSSKFFTTETQEKGKRLVVPELLQLPPAKRVLITNIVKTKTNYDITAENNNFKTFTAIQDIGGVLFEVGPGAIKKLKWLMR